MNRKIRIAAFLLSLVLFHSAAVQAQNQNDDSAKTIRDQVLADKKDSTEKKISVPVFFERFRYLRDSVYSAIAYDSAQIDRVITHDELMNYYHSDFADLLWNVSGFYIHDLGSYGKPISASVNGLGGAYCRILYDGIPVHEPELSWLNLNLISLENIDRIEIIKNSGMVINIVPKNPKDGEALTTIKFRSVFSDFQDVGAFFGRKIGGRMMLTLGGSHRETPGEQGFQQLSGGYITANQQTRYNANTIFLRLNYLLSQRWQAGYAYQTFDEKYDAYGPNRNGDRISYEFRTPGGIRKDERKDHTLTVDYAGQESYFRTSMVKSTQDRISIKFKSKVVPEEYRTDLYSGNAEYGRVFGPHGFSVGAEMNYHTFDSIPTLKRDIFDYAVRLTDQVMIGKGSVTATGVWKDHSRYSGSPDASVSAVFPLKQNLLWRAGAGVINRYPSVTEMMTDSSLLYLPQSIKPETLYRIFSSLKLKDHFSLNETVISGFYNCIDNAIVFNPLYFYTDTMRLYGINSERMSNYGVDLDITKKYYFLTFRLQQSVIKGDVKARHGIPWYRAHFIGQAERTFFNKNLHLNGYLSVKYFSRNTGYSFQDAPMRYYYAPRSSKGGWLFSARVVATIGDFKLFYEAENIFRARFTLLDGYDVTTQQWRFGLIWNLYN